MSAERRRLTLALLFSLLTHALLLSLTYGGQGAGLPGFGLPWHERRGEVPDLRIVLMPVQAPAAQPARAPAAEPIAANAAAPAPAPPRDALPPASIEQPAAEGTALAPSMPPAPTQGETAEAIAAQAGPTAEADPAPAPAIDVASAQATLRSEVPNIAAPTPIPAQERITLAGLDEAGLIVPAAAAMPLPAIVAAPGASSPATDLPALRERPPTDDAAQERATELARHELLAREARQLAMQLEAARIEAERREATRQAEARQEEARQEASRQEAARQEAQRAATARLEAERQDAARQAAARQEAAQQEAARQEALRIETARLESERQDAARLAAARLEASRQAAARQTAAAQDAAKSGAAQADEARREASRRAMGRQLDEEAAQREAASKAANLPSQLLPSSSSARRGRLFGRSDANAELVLYAEAWARKIQLNMTFETIRDTVKRPHVDPLVTVAIRSDGSVESVTIVVSSGAADIDDAIRRIVQGQLPYPAFAPALAREFDVIEIRRNWHFDMAIRLY